MSEQWTIQRAVERQPFFAAFQDLCREHRVGYAELQVRFEGDWREFRQKVQHGSNLDQGGNLVHMWHGEVKSDVTFPMPYITSNGDVSKL